MTDTVWYHLLVESGKAKLVKTEWNGSDQGLGLVKFRRYCLRVQNLSSGDLMCSMVIVVNNTVL